ncbi:MAG: nucleotidyl transferase AbiEii/AbiGii toxin family protein, partial [Ignavibacteriales bacterium]|nr:nucleotidyl transferase AbiEii/AbiGii toxin family protein [Ignavibacteriales bacterium]
MEQTVLTNSQQGLLNTLGASGIVSGFYLAGGTALAMQLHHRSSEDFDFFCLQDFDVTALQQGLLKLQFSELVLAERGTVYVRINKVSVSCIQYPYALLKPLAKYGEGIYLASVEDIAAMKLSTIAARGAKRDFVDLFAICKECFSLDIVFEFYLRRFQSSASDRYHLLRSVTYFDDAEDEP